MRRYILCMALCLCVLVFLSTPVLGAADDVIPALNLGEDGTLDSVQLLLILTAMALIPSILIMMTSFTRIIIVLSFVRNALGLQQTPPNQVLIGLALFLSLFIMSPVIDQINEDAYIPYTEGTITQSEALANAMAPMRTFMLKQTNTSDLNLFLDLAEEEQPETLDSIRLRVIIPAFITSELKRAFTIGFMIFLPFIIIDMVVASVLMSMGMMMVPPVMISLPFKVMLFVLVDGWGLIVQTLVTSFN